MHRVIMGLAPGDGRQVDHIDRNGLNNRRSNLRFATPSQNMYNASSPGNSTGFRGVEKVRGASRFNARIRVDGERFHLGSFPTAEDAARAYDAKAAEAHGEFAVLNFPEGS